LIVTWRKKTAEAKAIASKDAWKEESAAASAATPVKDAVKKTILSAAPVALTAAPRAAPLLNCRRNQL
jgi:hypothetical protein